MPPFAFGFPARLLPRSFVWALALATVASVRADWPQFRGPAGDGHAVGKGYPVRWSEQENVVWKAAVHGKAWSSPVIGGGRVWLTTATEDGRELSVVALDEKSGAVVLDQKLFDVAAPQFCHKFNSYASPTPVLDSGRVYVTFGSPGTACLDARSGKVLWERRDFVCNHYRGAGSSPILVGRNLILNFDGSDRQYVVALDAKTGRTVWETRRSIDFKDLLPNGEPEAEGDWRKGYSTPHLIRVGKQDQLISIGAKATYAYDPSNGTELWRVEERTAHSGSTRPVFANGVLHYPSGFAKGQLIALRPGTGRGDVVDANAPDALTMNGPATAPKLLWKTKRNVPNKPSLVRSGAWLFMIDDGGIASCVEAATGKELWRERVNGNYSASPILADGHLYFCSEEGKTFVVEAGPTFKVVAENQLPDGFMASPAADRGALYLRTRTHLYKVAGR